MLNSYLMKGHTEADPQWELQPCHDPGELPTPVHHGDPWYEDSVTSACPSEDLTFNDFFVDSPYQHPGPVHQARGEVYQENHRAANLHLQVMVRESSWFSGVE